MSMMSTPPPDGPQPTETDARLQVERHHWVSMFVGTLHAAFHLTDEEQVLALSVVNQLMEFLDVPGRGEEQELPMQLVLEVTAGFYTALLEAPAESHRGEPAGEHDHVVPLETWRSAFLRQLSTAYPDLSPVEQVAARKVFDDLLLSLGVPDRRPSNLPANVVRAARDS